MLRRKGKKFFSRKASSDDKSKSTNNKEIVFGSIGDKNSNACSLSKREEETVLPTCTSRRPAGCTLEISTVLYRSLVTAMSYIEQHCITSCEQLQLYCCEDEYEADDEVSEEVKKCISMMQSPDEGKISVGDFSPINPSIPAAAVLTLLRQYDPLVPPSLLKNIMEIVDASEIELLVVSPTWNHLHGVIFIALLHHLSKLCIQQVADADYLGRVFGDIVLREDEYLDGRQQGATTKGTGIHACQKMYDSKSKAQRIALIIRHMTKELKGTGQEKAAKHIELLGSRPKHGKPRSEIKCQCCDNEDAEAVEVATAKRRIEMAAEVLQMAEQALSPIN